MADLEAISICLGDKHYMMGSTPCPVDCSAFGFLAVLFYLYPEDFFFRKEAEEKFPNLKSYTERIKKTYWEDWDDLLSKEKQKWRNNWLDSDQTNTLNPWYKTFWMPIISSRDLMLGPIKWSLWDYLFHVRTRSSQIKHFLLVLLRAGPVDWIQRTE